MANTDFISFSLVDHKGDVSNVVVHVPTGQTLAELQAYSNAIAAELDAITGCQIQASNLSLQLTVPGTVKASPTANVDQEVGANFGYDAANTPYRHTIRVPGVLASQRVGELMDSTNSDVQAFNTVIVTGDGTTTASDKYSNDLTAFIQARVTFRKD